MLQLCDTYTTIFGLLFFKADNTCNAAAHKALPDREKNNGALRHPPKTSTKIDLRNKISMDLTIVVHAQIVNLF